jgi:hypothetical protein
MATLAGWKELVISGDHCNLSVGRRESLRLSVNDLRNWAALGGKQR